MPKYICYWCKKSFEGYKRSKERAKRTFCRKEHKNEWNSTLSGFWKGRKMSKSAREKMSKNHANVSGKNNPNWKGGRRIDKDGYVLVLNKKHPNCDYHGYVREHRLVIENSIGRYLEPEEVVHHRDGDRQNNDIKNLKLLNNGSEHQKIHYKENEHLKHSPKWKENNPASS